MKNLTPRVFKNTMDQRSFPTNQMCQNKVEVVSNETYPNESGFNS